MLIFWFLALRYSFLTLSAPSSSEKSSWLQALLSAHEASRTVMYQESMDTVADGSDDFQMSSCVDLQP